MNRWIFWKKWARVREVWKGEQKWFAQAKLGVSAKGEDFTAVAGLLHKKSSRSKLQPGNATLSPQRARWPFSLELGWKQRKRFTVCWKISYGVGDICYTSARQLLTYWPKYSIIPSVLHTSAPAWVYYQYSTNLQRDNASNQLRPWVETHVGQPRLWHMWGSWTLLYCQTCLPASRGETGNSLSVTFLLLKPLLE